MRGSTVISVASALLLTVTLAVTVRSEESFSDDPAWMPYIKAREGFQCSTPGAPKADKFGTQRYAFGMTSQIWKPAGVQEGALWKHDMAFWVPSGATSDVALIFVSGNYDGPKTGSDTIAKVAAECGITCASVFGVIQNCFGLKGAEELAAYTVQQYLATGDPTWTLHAAMTKSLVRTMDALEAVTAKPGVGVPLKRFIFTGHSRFGVASFWVAAADRRVVGIIPTGADMLNMSAQLQVKPTLFLPGRPYGDAMALLMKEKGLGCLALIDPWLYRQHLTMPKLVASGTHDHVVELSSNGLYWDALPGSKVHLFLANEGHGENANPATMAAAIGFCRLVSAGRPLPKIVWKATENGGTVTLTATTDVPAKAARIWSRLGKGAPLDMWKDQPAKADAGQPAGTSFSGQFDRLLGNEAAGYMEFDFDVDGHPYSLTTGVYISGGRTP